ncbi:divergent polysaccharide deacetylase family protein [Photobacterium lipolyticum]|uniref:Divergent polysaccharide deacetylase family protein n=1 Tax=Photobacterium lipolyticum TaxID=266810 RepID=A0A2T3MYJ3_9GAMM|nr:divergent polysaccharide deacetylase family protein [Photobacterium lipolyticum]PSW04911.1 divergent polysaccharide deacetylase family protein [Photobacterium lipolyticum]
MRRNALCFSFLIILFTVRPVAAARLAIVIDDLGYQAMPVQLSALPSEISISILPDTPFDLATAHQAERENRDTLLHMPMQPQRLAPLELTTLTADMPREELQRTLRHALSRVPNAIAINNHMGSGLTQNTQAMDWVMTVLAEKGLSFLDSRTTTQTVAFERAQANGVPALRRHIFLDHFRTRQFIRQQLELALKRARKYGYVVAIGHPYPVTLEALQQWLPEVEKQQVKLVRLSELYPQI